MPDGIQNELSIEAAEGRVVQNGRGIRIRVDDSRNEKLTDFGRAVLEDRYLLATDKGFQDLVARVAMHYGDDSAHAQRIYDYISNLWFMPSTPVLSNGGTERGLPISCFLNEASDSLDGIVGLWNENVWLAARGGGIGSYWGNLRSIGERVGHNGKTSGIIPFIRVMDSLTLAISQGSLRRGSAAVYVRVDHPEIEEFIEMRRPTGGDPNRKALNLHHGVIIPDEFMRAVERDEEWPLRSPKDQSIIRSVKARDLWIRLLTQRIESGEPYLIFIDHVNKALPEHHKLAGYEVKMSNLCSEITLPTGPDKFGKDRTAVCCLCSLNLELFLEWKDDPRFIEDVMRFLDNVLQDFIDKAPDSMERAAYSAARERSVGLGVMGLHSFLQAQHVPIESVMARVWNKKMFAHIRTQADAASRTLAAERGPCPDAAEYGIMERFSCKMAIAPTASISIITGGSSPGIEPNVANAFTHKTLSGSFTVRNKYLKQLLAERGHDDDETWRSITLNEGSVQHLDFLDELEKQVFKTAFELDQRWIVDLAADRAPYICQSQSVNIFLAGDVHKKTLHDIHYRAWKRGCKSLYYCRSRSIQRAESDLSLKAASGEAPVVAAVKPETVELPLAAAPASPTANSNDYEECLSCQ